MPGIFKANIGTNEQMQAGQTDTGLEETEREPSFAYSFCFIFLEYKKLHSSIKPAGNKSVSHL